MPVTVSVFVGTSLDGYLARPDGSFDFLPADGGGDAGGFEPFLASVDAVVMGRNTFEIVRAMDEWTYGSKPVVVLTHRSIDLDGLPQVAATSGEPAAIVKRLAERGLRNLYVDGGQTIQSFLRAGLVDRITVTTVPVLVGEGIALFGGLPDDVKLRHVSTRSFAGMVQSVYEVVR